MTVRALERRLASVHQIEGIVSALRALALAQQREAQRHLGAIRAHTSAVAGAMADALRTGSPRPRQASGRPPAS